MNILIRRESVNDPELMALLKLTVETMVNALYANKIYLPDNSIKIWIKEFNGKLFPKIEFDFGGQELQYDIDTEGLIKEVHFKSFLKTPNGIKRRDIEKRDANAILNKIDNCIRMNGVNP